MPLPPFSSHLITCMASASNDSMMKLALAASCWIRLHLDSYPPLCSDLGWACRQTHFILSVSEQYPLCFSVIQTDWWINTSQTKSMAHNCNNFFSSSLWVRDHLCVHQLPNLFLYGADAADKRHLRCSKIVCLSIPVSHAGELTEKMVYSSVHQTYIKRVSRLLLNWNWSRCD